MSNFLDKMKSMNERVVDSAHRVDTFQNKKIKDMSKEELIEVVIWFGMAHKIASDRLNK